MADLKNIINQKLQDHSDKFKRDFHQTISDQDLHGDQLRERLQESVRRDNEKGDKLVAGIDSFLKKCENNSKTYQQLHELHLGIFAQIQIRIAQLFNKQTEKTLPTLNGIIDLLVGSKELSDETMDQIKERLTDCLQMAKEPIQEHNDMVKQLDDAQAKITEVLGEDIVKQLDEGMNNSKLKEALEEYRTKLSGDHLNQESQQNPLLQGKNSKQIGGRKTKKKKIR